MAAPIAELPRVSIFTLRFFRRIARSYFRRHFRAVQVHGSEALANVSGPLIVYGNHVSWWDPLLCVLIAHTLLPDRRHYAPMDSVPLKRYPILRKIGIFPVELASGRGAVQFLRTAQAVLASGAVLWITPQGRFADVRERPLAFKAGLASLVHKVPGVQLVPMAAEYPFWNERLPEALVRVGDVFRVDASEDMETTKRMLESALEKEMDKLQALSMARDPLQFQTLLEGKRGTGGFYAFGKRLRALVTGKGFQEDHSARDARVDEAIRR